MAQPTKQGDVGPGRPPKNRQFGQPGGNPRHNGAWKKEDTARFKLERMMEIPESELIAIKEDPTSPLFERKLATAIKDGQWREIREMMEQVYGKPTEFVDSKHSGEVSFVNSVPRPRRIND